MEFVITIKAEPEEMDTALQAVSTFFANKTSDAESRKHPWTLNESTRIRAYYAKKNELKDIATILYCEREKSIYFTKKLPYVPGVYMLVNKYGKGFYIGSSKKLAQRIPQSFCERKNIDIADRIVYFETETVNDAKLMESFLINRYKPIGNVQFPIISNSNYEYCEHIAETQQCEFAKVLKWSTNDEN